MAIRYKGVGTWATSTSTTLTVTLPSHVAGDLLIVRAIRKPFTSPTSMVINTTGWATSGTQYANGSTANGSGVGSMAVCTFWKVATSSSETNPVVTWGVTVAPGAAVAVVYEKDSYNAWVGNPTGVGGINATAATTVNDTLGTHISVLAGDMVDFWMGWCDDSGTPSAASISQPGVSYTVTSDIPATALDTSLSNDLAADGGYAYANTGTSSSAATITASYGTSEQHVVWMTRFRVTNDVDHAQAQALIKAVSWGVAQAQASIKGPQTYPYSKSITDVFRCGAECDLTHWTASGGSVTVDTGIKHNGNASIKIAAAGAATYRSWTTTTINPWVVRLSLYLDGLPTANAALTLLTRATTGDVGIFYDQASGKLALMEENYIASAVLGPVISNQTWTDIDLHINGTSQTVQWKVNGVTQSPLTLNYSGTWHTWYVGQQATYGTFPAFTTYTAYIDDLVISNTATDYPIDDGYVVSGETWVSDIGRTYAQAQALIILVNRRHAQAAALIYSVPQYNSIQDSFTRTVTDGWGSSDNAGDWYAGNTSGFSVNGSKALLDTSLYSGTSYQELPNLLVPQKWKVYFEWSMSAVPDLNVGLLVADGLPSALGQFTRRGKNAGVHISSSGAILVATGFGVTYQVDSISATYVAGDTWVCKSFVYWNGSQIANNYYMWNKNSPETVYSGTTTRAQSVDSPPGHITFAIPSFASNTTIAIDNLEISRWYDNGYAQAQTLIEETIPTTTYSAYAQAQALIVTTVQQYAQTLGIIKTINLFSAQAQARIKNTYQAYAQANTWIEITNQSYANTQTTIKTTYRGYGQAQANIKATYRAYAQAQGQVKQVYQGYSQAQILVVKSNIVFALSQATIKSIYQKYGQALGAIKTSYQSYGQAMSATVQSSTVYAQALAQIKSASQAYGQAQAYFESEFRAGYAQTLAQVGRTDNLYTAIDEEVIDDNDYIVAPKVTGVKAVIQLAPLVTPDWPIDHILHYRAWVPDTLLYGTIRLKQDTTIINSRDLDAVGSNDWESFKVVLTPAQISLITDYSNLSVEVESWYQGEEYPTLISQIYLQVPSGSGSKTYRRTGQAQAYIEPSVTTYNAYAQANALIVRTEQSYSQANALIVRTENAYAQAQAQIEQTYRVYAQALATIKTSYQVYAQANAYIRLSGLQVYGQAQAQIKQTYQVYAQANAHIYRIEQGYAQAQTLIEATYQAYAQAQARLIAFGVNQFAQAATIIAGSYTQSAQAQTKINAFGTVVYAQALAQIRQTYQGYANALAQIKRTYQGYANAQVQIEQTYLAPAQAQAEIKQSYLAYGQSQAIIKQAYQAFAQSMVQINAQTQVYAQTQTWIEATYQAFALAMVHIEVQTQAHAQAQALIKNTYQVYATALAQVKRSYLSVAQAQTLIRQSYQACANAQAQIKSTYQNYAQAQARLIAFNVQAYAQAATIVAGSYTQVAQAQAKINAYGTQAYAQAQAQIENTYQVYGQAQTIIKSTYNAHAQSIVGILAVYRSYAQAQVIILTTNNAYAQALAWIETTNIVHAQAQARVIAYGVQQYAQASVWISGAFVVSAQAQARIIAYAVNAHAQAIAQIETTYAAYAQALAWIEVTYNAYAQAQTIIQSAYQAYAQSQAVILNIYQVYGQAQTWIKTTSQAFAQAQAWIKITNQAYAQAVAYIQISNTVYANAGATIKTSYSQSGQAQALVGQIYLAYANAQVSIRTTINVYAQAATWIKIASQAYAQAAALIVNGVSAYAQALALVVASQTVYAQAQALIVKATAYGQAQALIRVVYILHRLIISDISMRLILTDVDPLDIKIKDEKKEHKISDTKEFDIQISDRLGMFLRLSDRNYWG